MLNYPVTLTTTCRACGATVTLARCGDGRPMEGRLNYWYTTDHHCTESDRDEKARAAERDLLREVLGYGH
jgi:hypothetical protein